MKKRNLFKKAGVVALSSLLAAGSLAALAGCGNNSATTLTVFIFCNESDKQVNESIMNEWAVQYAKENNLGFDIDIEFTPSTDKSDYYSKLNDYASGGVSQLPDVMYLAPRYVKLYSRLGYVMDLTDYLSPTDIASTDKIWGNALSYYGYDKTDTYTYGQLIHYNGTSKKFETASGSAVGLYGLPKDYSNFSLGFNKQFFSAELVEAYQTKKASEVRTAKNPSASNTAFKDGATPVAEYHAAAGNHIATFAGDGTYDIYDANGNVVGQAEAHKGQEAPMLAIGVPVTYKPFNFYIFNDFDSALAANDPIACLVSGLTAGQGFTVTIPGLPGWTFNIDKAQNYDKTNNAANYAKATNPNAVYDDTIGHTVLTYQEYGALSWAMSYYLNTFAWDNNNEGYGGRTVKEGEKLVHYGIFGGEQYEYSQGNTMYMLPWLAANEADFVDVGSTTALNKTGVNTLSQMADDAHKNVNAYSYAGTDSELRDKVNLDGSPRKDAVQYGINSKNFLEVYAAYANHGAVWNANAGGAKSGLQDDGSTGWDYFRQGRSIFYGAGSWDAASRNGAEPDYFDFGQMPTPVAEDYALYSETSTPDYDAFTLKKYANKNNIKGTGENALANDKEMKTGDELTAAVKAYRSSEIYANQILRQDKWAARMDSVGYAANGRLAGLSSDDPEGWKAKATASLIAALTVREQEQITLTYAGAQLPNFKQYCTDFLMYQQDGYENGAFKDMITPDGFADTTDPAEGAKIWEYYYKVAKAMAKDSFSSSLTVKQWVEQCGYGDYDGSENGNPNKPLRYDPAFADVPISSFPSSEQGTRYHGAMRALRMVNFTYADRDLNIRMQTGLNAVRDSTMYTTSDTRWLDGLNAAVSTQMLTYASTMRITDATLSGALKTCLPAAIGRTFETADQDKEGCSKWWSPAYYATDRAITCNTSLRLAIKEEQDNLAGR